MAEAHRIGRLSEGKCFLCRGLFSKRQMTAHLKSCPKQEWKKSPDEMPGSQKVFHLVVEGTSQPEYWVHIEAPVDATLDDLDYLLREIWLECCHHMSAFTIGEEAYSASPLQDWGEQGMRVALRKLLRPGMKFTHEYDFGTTTRLTLRVLAERDRETPDESIRVLARNEPPDIRCGLCGKPATQVCGSCRFTSKGWFCDDCARLHDCGADILLPVVNSPRTGQCAYDGE